MREDDDDAPQQGTAEGTLADGLGETAEPGEYSSTSEPYGDDGIDDPYGEDSYDDDAYGEDSDGDESTQPDDTTAEDTTTADDDGGYGDGETGDGGVVIYDDSDDTDDTEAPDDGSDAPDGTGFDDSDLLAQDASPLEGVGFLIDELRDALFGDDDESASSVFEADPADLASDTDLDLTGDGVVDRADLHEAESPLDFDVDLAHGPGHDGGVIDA